MIAGCYHMDLYCDASDNCEARALRRHGGTEKWTSNGLVQTEADARKDARADGWRFERGGDRVLCRNCWESGIRFATLDAFAEAPA